MLPHKDLSFGGTELALFTAGGVPCVEVRGQLLGVVLSFHHVGTGMELSLQTWWQAPTSQALSMSVSNWEVIFPSPLFQKPYSKLRKKSTVVIFKMPNPFAHRTLPATRVGLSDAKFPLHLLILQC